MPKLNIGKLNNLHVKLGRMAENQGCCVMMTMIKYVFYKMLRMPILKSVLTLLSKVPNPLMKQ